MIALGRGGATETVRPLGEAADRTGVFFAEQTADAVIDAIGRFERDADRFDPRAARRQAVLFRKERFETELFGYLDEVAGGAGSARKARLLNKKSWKMPVGAKHFQRGVLCRKMLRPYGYWGPVVSASCAPTPV